MSTLEFEPFGPSPHALLSDTKFQKLVCYDIADGMQSIKRKKISYKLFL